MSDLKIIEIDLNNKKDLNIFVELPWEIYRGNPHWVPPLKMAVHDLLNHKKHPFYQTAFTKAWVATKNDKVVGRIMAISNYTFNHFENNRIGHFGFFETINEQKVVELLIQAATDYLKSKGHTSIEGPMNPGTNYECGMLVEKYDDSPQIMMTYNPMYYNCILEKLGFSKAMDLLAYNMKAKEDLPKLILDIASRTEKKSKVTYRTLNLKKWNDELDTMFEIYNSAWEKNWGFVPMTKEEFYHTAKDLRSIVDPNLVNFVMVEGKPAGFILALPDLNQVLKQIPSGKLSPIAIYKLLTAKKRINRVRVITMGIKAEYRKMGLETLLYTNLQKTIRKNSKITDIEMSWILESNLEMNKPLLRMSGPAYKRYRIYKREIV